MIIGLTGTLAAGKGTISEFFKERGFTHYSVRAFLTEEIRKRGMEVNRDSMVNIGNELREKYGASYIAEQLYEIGKKENCIIESLRTPGEVESLKNKGEFYLISIDADPKIRYERILRRASETDKISFEEFLENERREMNSTDVNKQNISKCIEMSDFKIINNGSIDELKRKVHEIYGKIMLRDFRPSWDEYFIEISKTVAKRATCDRGRSGCVIAKNKQILVTGYVGSPIGLPHCDEVGHQMKTLIHEDGRQSQHCVRTAHAEQNAICQAAKLGIPIDGATLYCKMTPCSVCAKMIINSGIKRVVCEKKYHDGKESEDLFKQAGVALEILDENIERYENQ